jgi:hypothetical protein
VASDFADCKSICNTFVVSALWIPSGFV